MQRTAEAVDVKNKFLQDVDGPTFHHFSKAWFSYEADLPGTWHGLGQRYGTCEHDLSPTHNLSQALIAGFPTKLNSAQQFRRQPGGQSLGQTMCWR